MKKILLFILLPFVGISQTQIGSDIDGEAELNYSGRSVSLSSDGTIVAIGAPYNSVNGSKSGHVRIFKYISDVWTQIGSDIDGKYANDEFGFSVSLSSDGSTVAIGSPNSDGYNGHVSVYENILGVWTQKGSNINGLSIAEQSGFSVSLSSDGTIVAIGVPYCDSNGSNSGQVRVYKNISNVWTQIGFGINGEVANDLSGNSVSLSSDGTIIAIGASHNDGNKGDSGHVRIYKNLSGVWTQIGSDINGEDYADLSGFSVSLSSDGTIVAIGAPHNNGTNSGHVRIYKNISNVWTQIGSDIDGEDSSDKSGFSVSLSSDGTIVAIGAIFGSVNYKDHGHVRIYKNISGVWTKIGSDIDGESTSDASGYSVSLSSDGGIVAIGAINNNGNLYYAGHVRIYNLKLVLSSDSFVLANFSVYPNPASELVTISLEKSLQLEKVNIYNNLGQLLKTENKNVINLNSLAKGSYFFEVITNKGKATKQILVQ